MGCGKTLTAIAVIGALYDAGKVRKLLVVAPTTVVPVWPQEMDEKADFPFVSAVMLGTKQKRLKAYSEMMRYADARKDEPLRMVCINYQEIFRDGIQQELAQYDADAIILDEGHYIKNHSAATAKAAYALGDKCRHKLLLTGPPMTGRQDDRYGEFRVVDSKVVGTNFYAFRNRYCVMGGFQNKVIIGEKNHDELVRKLHGVSLRVTKAEALDLPEETFETRYVELGKSEAEVYEQLRKTGLAELSAGEVTAPLVITKLLRLQQVCGGFAQPDDAAAPVQIGSSKLDALRDIVSDVVLDEEQKLVIFARFLPEVHAIRAMLEDMKIQHVCIYGAVKQEERGEIVRQFQEDPEIKVFVAQIATAGLGITLHAASTAVFYSKDFNYANVEQARARIHRIGQRHPCTYIDLVARGTIDERIQESLDKKQDLSAGICDRWRDYFMKEQ